MQTIYVICSSSRWVQSVWRKFGSYVISKNSGMQNWEGIFHIGNTFAPETDLPLTFRFLVFFMQNLLGSL